MERVLRALAEDAGERGEPFRLVCLSGEQAAGLEVVSRAASRSKRTGTALTTSMRSTAWQTFPASVCTPSETTSTPLPAPFPTGPMRR